MNNKRINFFFIISLFIFIPSHSFSQDIRNWTSHISYWADITQMVRANDKIYCLTDGKLFIYNDSDGSLEEYIKYDGGNTDIAHIAYNSKYNCVFITRTDANIELLYDDKSYTNIPDLKNYSAQNLDKTINHVFMSEDFVYLSTNYGFTTINLDRKEIRESGIFHSRFYSISSFGNSLYAATEQGILTTDMNSNIQDFTNWNKFPVANHYTDGDYQFRDEDIRKITVFKDQLHFLFPDSAIYIMNTPESVKSILKGSKPFDMYVQNERLFIVNRQSFWDYSDLSTFNRLNIDRLNYVIPNGNKTDEYWTSSVGNNLSQIKTQNGEIEYLKRWIYPQGPASNFPFSQNYQNNQLLVTGGGFYGDRLGNLASISIFKDSKWTNIYEYSITEESGIYARDFVYAISDPRNPSHIFAASWGEGLYEFENNSFKQRYNHTNSAIEETVREDETGEIFRTTRVSGMAYDRDNNLWIMNSMTPHTIKIYTKDNQWVQLYYSELDDPETNTKNIVIDRFSRKWFTSVGTSSTGLDAYIFILDDNNTPTERSDDRYKFISGNDFFNENNVQVNIQSISGIAEDSNGNMWIGTNLGPYWIRNSASSIPSEIRLNRIMVARDEDAGTITQLLEGVPVNAICIDGAGRKWIGTQTTGLYLISSDYQQPELLEHFTLENSPLPSDNILSLSIDSQGVVYIGTERGLMAYYAGVTKGAEEFSDVYVYPNPVRPDFNGLITVTGLKTNSHVKITDVRGNLIVEGNSLGGQFMWNGLNGKGRRVDTGVYVVFGSSEDGSEGVVTKIMIVNE